MAEHTTRQPHAAAGFQRVALLLQGGGALGSYQAGVYAAMAEAGFYQNDPGHVTAHTRRMADAQQALDAAYARWAELDG